MSISTKWLNPDLASRVTYWLPRLRELREEAQNVGGEMRRAVEALQTQGLSLPAELWERHQKWCEKVSQVSEQFLADPAFGVSPPPPSGGVKVWVDHLTHIDNEIQRARQSLEATRSDLTAVLEKIVDLKAKDGPSEDLTQIQSQAHALMVQMGNRSLLPDACERAQKFVALWELLTDIEQGLIDSPEASARADAVAAGFGGRLVLQVAQGRFQPSHGWPLRDVATVVASLRDRLEKKTAPITPLPGPAAPLLRPVASRAPANRMVDLAPLEMVQSKLQWSSEQEADPLAASCYKTLRRAVAYVIGVTKEYIERESARQEFEESLQFAATAQSALRVHLHALGRRDEAQGSVYFWLSDITKAQKVFISRHMRLEDPGDPHAMEPLCAEIDQRLYARQRPKRIQKALGNMEFKFNKLTGDADKDFTIWGDIVRIVTDMMKDEEVPPSSKELREALLPRLGDIPCDLEPNPQFELVLRALREYQQREPAPGETDAGNGKRYSPEAAEVSQLLRGRKMLLVGGIPDPVVRERLESAFELGELQWEGAKEHSSSAKFQPLVAAADVSVVCLIIKLIGHGHVDDIKEYCRQADRPLVLLHKGFGVNQIARCILDQAGQRLKETAVA
jgi:hypothetical protein